MHLSPDIERLLARFDFATTTYLREEMDQALTLREQLTPHLLAILEDVAENPYRYLLEDRNGHTYAASLLAHFQEPAAHLPIIRAFSIPGEHLEPLWGDMSTETLPTLLHRTCNGSVEQIKQLIGNRQVDEFVRGAAVEALTFAVADATITRDEAVAFLQSLFTGEEAEPGATFWGMVAATLCDLHPGDSMAVLDQAMTDGLFDARFIGPDDIARAASLTMDDSLEALQQWAARRIPADIHGYIAWFDEFQPKAPAPLRSSTRDVGKNKRAENKKKTNRAKNKEAKKTRKKNR